MEELRAMMADDYAFQIGVKGNLKEKVQALGKHGIEPGIPTQDLDILTEAEQIRHLILHNGGKVSTEFLRRTKRTDVKLGEDLPLPIEYTLPCFGAGTNLVAAIYTATALKYFDHSDTERESLERIRNRILPTPKYQQSEPAGTFAEPSPT